VVSAVMPLLGSIALYYALLFTKLPHWMKEHRPESLIIYTVGFIVLAGLALLPTYAQSLLGGFAFGLWTGSGAAVVGFAGGAIIGYEIALRASGDRVMRLMDEHPKWRIVRDALVGRQVGGGVAEVAPGFWKTLGMVALFRCPPNSPFAITNLVMASIKVPRVPFLLGTLLGMAPRASICVMLGAGISSFKDKDATSTPRWLIATGVVSMIIVIGIAWKMANNAIAKQSAMETPNDPQIPPESSGGSIRAE